MTTRVVPQILPGAALTSSANLPLGSFAFPTAGGAQLIDEAGVVSYVSTTVGPGGAALLAGTQTFTGANTFRPTAVTGTGPVNLYVRPVPNNVSKPIAAGQLTPTAIFGDVFPGPTTNRVWATGAILQQYEYVFIPPTYDSVAAGSVMTTAANVLIGGAPSAGSGNMTITNSYALLVVGDTSRFGGTVECAKDVRFAAQDKTTTPGNATIDLPSGRVAVAMGASSVVVTNSLVKAESVVICTLQTLDIGFTQILRVVPNAGGFFTITGNGNAVVATNIGFIVINPTI